MYLVIITGIFVLLFVVSLGSINNLNTDSILEEPQKIGNNYRSYVHDMQ